MFVRNYLNLQKGVSLKSSRDSAFVDDQYNLIDTNGESIKPIYNTWSYDNAWMNMLPSKIDDYVLSSDDSDVTIDDYNIENIDTSIIKDRIRSDMSIENDTMIIDITLSFSATENNTIINKIGLMKNISTENSLIPALVFAERLKDPITLNAGEFFSYRIQITL